MEIYYFMIEAVPGLNNPEHTLYGGAYINCWIKAASKSEALNKAKAHIEEENWQMLKVEDSFIAQRHMYEDDTEGMECYDEARRGGLASVFYTWLTEPDTDGRH